MTFFDDISDKDTDTDTGTDTNTNTNTDTDESGTDTPIEDTDIDIGVATTEYANGELDVEIIVYVNDIPVPAPHTPTTDVEKACERWSVGADDPDPAAATPHGSDHPPVEEVSYDREGWTVIYHPDNPESWLALPAELSIDDISDRT